MKKIEIDDVVLVDEVVVSGGGEEEGLDLDFSKKKKKKGKVVGLDDLGNEDLGGDGEFIRFVLEFTRSLCTV